MFAFISMMIQFLLYYVKAGHRHLRCQRQQNLYRGPMILLLADVYTISSSFVIINEMDQCFGKNLPERKS